MSFSKLALAATCFQRRQSTRPIVAILITALLAACSGNDIVAAPTSGFRLSPSLGLIQNATVNYYQADGTTLLASAITGSDGIATMMLGSYNGPVVVEVLGDDIDALYFDEAAGTLLPFPAGQSLHALLPFPSHATATPLTELAFLAAQRQNLFPLSATQITQLNEIVRAALAPGLQSLLSEPQLTAASTSFSSNEAGNYALLLAALAELASGDASPALAVLSALRADLSDGKIDSQSGGNAITAPYSQFIEQMQTALSTAAGKYGYVGNAQAQKPASTTVDTSSLNAPTSSNNGDPVCQEFSPATVNSALVGSYALRYAETESGAPFANEAAVSVSINSDSSLDINGQHYTSPVICTALSFVEIIWVDAEQQLEYALTNNGSGVFNEINVGDQTRTRSLANETLPTFLGQLRLDESTGPAPTDPQEGNQGKARVIGNGFTGVVNGTEFTYNGSMVLVPNNSGDGYSRIEGSNPNSATSKWRVFVPAMVGTYTCDDAADNTVLQHIFQGGFGSGNGVASGDGSCLIKVLQAGPIYEGYFTASFEQPSPSQPLASVTDGYYYLDTNPPAANSGPIPAGQSGMSYRDGGQDFLINNATVMSNTPNFDYLTLVSPDSTGTQFRLLPNQTGTYQCGQGSEFFRNFHVNFSHDGKMYSSGTQSSADPAGSQCSMTVTQVGQTMPSSGTDYSGTIEAQFTGTFIAGDGSSLVVSNGFIRAFGNQP